jgi:hypothetical protein
LTEAGKADASSFPKARCGILDTIRQRHGKPVEHRVQTDDSDLMLHRPGLSSGHFAT